MEILYRDEAIIAVNKPAGLLSIPDGYNKSLPNLKALLDAEFTKVWTVHRLDKETSGVMVFALAAESHRALSIQFEKRQIQKTYLALAEGLFSTASFVIDVPLCVNADRKHRTVPDPVRGKPAFTRIDVVEQHEHYALVKAFPKTGYLHQIRSHLSHIAHPVVNDSLYGATGLPPECPLRAERLMLHALEISFVHPTLHEQMTLSAPVPCEFSSL